MTEAPLPTQGRYRYAASPELPSGCTGWRGMGFRRVMGVALRPCITGQPYRPRPLRRALRAMLERRHVMWVTTAGGICDHICWACPRG